MNRALKSIFVVPFVLGCACLAPALHAQQEPAAAADDALATKSGERIEVIEMSRKDILRLTARFDVAKGEERTLLQRRLARKKLQTLRDVNTLVDDVLEMEKQGLDTATYRAKAEEYVGLIAKRVEEHIEAVEQEIVEAGAERESLSPPERAVLEARITEELAWLDDLYEAMAGNLQRMDSLELDSTEARSYLEETVKERAEMLSTRIELALEQKAAAQKRLTEAPGDADRQAELRTMQSKLSGTRTSMATSIQVMNQLGLDTAQYQQLMLQTSGEITTDILDADVALNLLGQWWERVKTWFTDNGPTLIFKALLFLVIVVAFRILARVVRRVVSRAVSTSRFKLSQLMQSMVVAVAGNVVMLMGLLVALSQLGISLGPLLAGLGIAGFIVGFALQETLANFAAGMMILLYRPYDVEDVIDVAGGVFGKVSNMSLVSTTILTFDNQTLIVPNAKIWGDVIKNVTAQKERRVDLVFGISYSDDIPKVETILKAILADHEKVLDDPEPNVRLHNLGDSSVDFIVRPWVKTDDYWDVYWDVMREVKMRFDREGISIPFPQRDVHFYRESANGEQSAVPEFGKDEAASSRPQPRPRAAGPRPVPDEPVPPSEA